ncbi:hypothetical protein SOP93_17630 [Peribacillus frigoritolerans]|uniref:hypothetical protein n=1 Tax=Peribacillus frigoritolerans TaxID=450367 RepID=UPI002B252E86|nr:hypothetical protein [Peribacillus frigoritolerans]MEB2492978.1 hypothetical protein [Peribacillus frigoritolerans]
MIRVTKHQLRNHRMGTLSRLSSKRRICNIPACSELQSVSYADVQRPYNQTTSSYLLGATFCDFNFNLISYNPEESNKDIVRPIPLDKLATLGYAEHLKRSSENRPRNVLFFEMELSDV